MNNSGIPFSDTSRNIKNFLSGDRLYLILVIICLLLYAKSIFYGFSPLDDHSLIVSRIDWLSDLRNIITIFTQPLYWGIGEYYYRPILLMSFMLDTITGSGLAAAYHITNIVLHLISTLLVFKVLMKFDIPEKSSFWLSVIFAVHPINVSTVVWIPGRNDSLLIILALSSFLFWINYVKTKEIRFLTAHLLSWILALLTKENAIVLPVLFYVYQFLISGNKIKLPKLKIALAWIFITVVWITLRISILTNPQDLEWLTLPVILKNIFTISIVTVERVVFPIYQYVSPNLYDVSILPGLIYLPIIILICFFLKIRLTGTAIFGIIWFISFLIIPELWVSVFNIGYTYEHRLYAPLIGLLLVLSQIPVSKSIHKNSSVVITVVVLILILFSVKTFYRMDVYKNTDTYSAALASESPSMPFANDFRGTVLLEKQEYEASIPFFSKCLDADPEREDILLKRATAYKSISKFDLSIHDLDRVIMIDSLNSDAHSVKGDIYRKLNQLDLSLLEFDRAIRLNPQMPAYYNDRGLIQLNLSNIQEAVKDFTKAIELDPAFVLAYHNRSATYFLTGNYEAALKDLLSIENLGGKVNIDFLNQIIDRLNLPG